MGGRETNRNPRVEPLPDQGRLVRLVDLLPHRLQRLGDREWRGGDVPDPDGFVPNPNGNAHPAPKGWFFSGVTSRLRVRALGWVGSRAGVVVGWLGNGGAGVVSGVGNLFAFFVRSGQKKA